MQDNYPNLPGILSEFKDGGLVLRNDPNPPATESILLLGTAIDGPVMEPVAVDANTVELLFGRAVNGNGTPNGSTLVKAFEQAYAAGCRDIRVMRVTGKKAVGTVKAASMTVNNDKSNDEVLGVAEGNAAVTFELNQEVISVNTVLVTAGGVDLTPADITVTNGSAGTNAKVVLKPNVCDSGSEVFITYSYLDNGSTVTVVENVFTAGVGADVPYIATGADQEFPLEHVPKVNSTRVYFNGIEAPADSFTVDTAGPSVTLLPGFAPKDTNIDVSYLFVETVTEQPTVKIEAVYGGILYNQIKVEVKNVTSSGGTVIGKALVITKPESKKAQITEQPMVFSSIDFPTFRLLAQAVNSYPVNNIVRLSFPNRFLDVETKNLQVQSSTALATGEDGVNVSKQAMYEALGGKRDAAGFVVSDGAYQLLENYTVDMVVPIGVYADDELAGRYDNFAYQLALACAVMSHRNSTTHGVIATSSPEETGLVAISAHVNKLLSLSNTYYMRDRVGNEIKDSEGNKMDLGRYISVVVGPDPTFGSGRFGVYAENSPAIYAGMVSNMQVQSAPTNKRLPGAIGLRFNYSNSQLDALTGARFVTYKTKQNGAITAVTDAMTAAQASSDYRRLVTYRVVKQSVNQVRDVCDPYIGEPNEVAQRNAMTAAISKRLDKMKEAGALTDYTFQVIATPEMQLLGQAQIELTIVPPMELRQITTIVSLRATL